MKFKFVVLALLLPLCWGWDAGAARAAHFNLIEIQDTINPGVQDFIEHAVEESSEDGAEFLLVLLDTPGGLVTSMRKIVQTVLNAPMPVVVFVYPQGAQAASAGVFITVAADIAAMAPGTNIGAASPVTGTGEDAPKTMEKKISNDLAAFARSVAGRRGRNAEWLEKAVRDAVSVSAREAFAKNVIDLVADDPDDLLERLDGWELKHRGASVTLSTKGLERRTIEPGWQHSVLRSLANPNIAYILLLIGLAGLYFELSQPGVVLPGVVGSIALILALYALQALSVNYAGLLLVLLSIVFFILEIKIASYGMLSIAGVVCLVLGSLMLFRGPGEMSAPALSVLVPGVVTISAFFVAVATLAFRAQARRPIIGESAFEGATGVVKRELAPEGKVFVNGELWLAEAEEVIEAGERVVVVSAENLKLKVKRIGAS